MAVLTLLAAATTGPAQAVPRTDPGSTRVTAEQRGLVLTTATADEGRYRCIAVRGFVSSCAVASQRPLLVQHIVERGKPAVLGPLVVAGLAGRDAVRVRVRVGTDVRSLAPRRFGAYLAVFPATARQRSLVIAERLRDGTVRVTDYRRSSPRWQPVAGSIRVERTLVDPVPGARAWLGQLVWRTAAGALCQHVGTLVSGRVGSLLGSVFSEYPVNDGGACVRPGSLAPLSASITTGSGRLTLAGFVRPDVRALAARFDGGAPVNLPVSRRGAFVLVRRAADSDPVITIVGTAADGSSFEQVVSRPREPS